MLAGVITAVVVVVANRLARVFLVGLFRFRRRAPALLYCGCVQGVKMLLLAVSFIIIFGCWPGNMHSVCLGVLLGSTLSTLRLFISSH
ncbi:MAG: hypothetical protein VXW87_01885 [Pseudomonadota bacterium]|nr:hypothetical protein [Pseudomonadota bacterium]